MKYNSETNLLAYVRVKIEDQPDKADAGGTSDQSKSGSDAKDAAKEA
jgi:hypothetical protein